MIKKALIIGGASGIGLAIAKELSTNPDYSLIHIVDRQQPVVNLNSEKIKVHVFDLMGKDYSFFDKFLDVDFLMVTAGFGHLSLFENVSEEYIISSMEVNAIAPMRIIHHFYPKILNSQKFLCGIMVSIAGFLSSPFFSVYGASKAALKIFIESVNVELKKFGTSNRILNISPGSIVGTGFRQQETDLNLLSKLSKDIIDNLEKRNDLYIPLYDEIYHDVLERYHEDFRKEGDRSYDYKLQSGRM